ncbi:Metallo-dependent hydrolase [Thozetella sp. PMI_491]|nr:Metallo-dependent hydrolase [Thozetella sp. PMI_491]
MAINEERLREFCLALPKTELHAHLTGSVSRDMLHRIWKTAKERDPDLELEDPLLTLEDIWHSTSFFVMFTKYIYKLVNNEEAVRVSTLDVLKNFEQDGVMHLELRTTPRVGPNMSKDQYVKTVLDAISEFNQTSKTMKTFLILSMDRRNTQAQAMEAVDLAIKYRDAGVVGVDLCGDYKVGDARTLKPCFEKAKAASLHITTHFGETKHGYGELELLLSYEPERLGHVIYITPEIKQEIVHRKLGIEICLTTNVVGKHVESYTKHHLQEWLQEDCPIALCTDDVGVVESPSSNEYFLAGLHLSLPLERLWQIALGAIDCAFVSEEEKELCRKRLRGWKAGEGQKWLAVEA